MKIAIMAEGPKLDDKVGFKLSAASHIVVAEEDFGPGIARRRMKSLCPGAYFVDGGSGDLRYVERA
jgi:hypothetical protein